MEFDALSVEELKALRAEGETELRTADTGARGDLTGQAKCLTIVLRHYVWSEEPWPVPPKM
jgi:hypothetical protein